MRNQKVTGEGEKEMIVCKRAERGGMKENERESDREVA
jgi:hypothetical protein